MLAKYDKFSRLEKPKMTLCNPNDAPIILQSGGKGTADSPYRITSVAQLVDIRNKVNSGDASYISANYILMADIDISSETPWISIGTTVNNFQGVFDGNGKSIVGLSITTQSGSHGLFGRANNATIKNLRLHGGNINRSTAASIVYDTFGNTLIEKCVSDVSFNITASSSTVFVGGLVNTLGSSSTIKNCCCLSSFVATDRDIGFGGIIASGTGTVQKCFFAGAIAETAYSSFGVISTNNNAVITDCYYDVTKRPVSNYVLVNENTTGFATELMTGSAANDNMTALDFADVWRTVHNNYPSLRVQKQSASFMPEYGNFINHVRDESLTINFNAISELTFVAEKADKNYMYDYYRMKRQVLVNELGYFVITGVSESVDENGKKVKNITSSSCEIELNNVALPYIPKGTYKLYDVLDTAHSLLHYIMPSIPAWNLAAIDPTLAQTQRTFDDESGTVYGFLMNKIAETYECIVEYDILTRTITLTSKTAALDNTGIFLSKNNIATGVEYSENADEYANCISVRGGSDDVNIGLVNPMGSSILYNFSYDVSSGLMSDDLIDALETWRQAVEDAEDSYYALQLERARAIDDLVNANTDLLTKQSIYRAAVQTYDIARAGGNDVSEALEKVNTAKANYDAAVIVANQLSAAIASLGNSIAAITATLQFDQFMSNDLITELSRCMQMATYSDDNIIFADIMSQEEKLGWMKTLYNKAKRLLNGGQIGGICEPRRQITVNTQGFVFNEKFKDSADELECGCLIAVEMPSGEVESYILQKYSINYDEKSLDLTFGNRFRPSDPTGIFKDLYNSNSDMASIVASNYIQWGEQIAKVNELELDRYRNLEINTDRVITSTTNRVTIDENGIVCKSTDPLTKEDEKYGLKIADGTILFTEYDDANDTYSGKMAVGRVVYDDGREDYGILGGSIVANTVTADKIVAGSVEKGRNLVKDGSFTNYGWLGSIGLHSVEKTGGFDEGSYFKGITDDASAEYSIKSSNRFMVTPNLDYRASFYYKATEKTGTIASCSNYNSTVPGTTKITSNAHGLSNGITKGVIISGTTDYNGIFDVTYINANSFYINKVFTSSQTGTWKYGWNAGISEIKMKVHWYSADAEASLLSTSVLGAVDGSAGWTRLNEAFVAPSNADFASVEMYVKGFAGEVDFDGIMLEQSPTLGDYSPYIGDLTARYTVINDEGVTVRNGKMTILNNDETPVFSADEDGNLTINGSFKSGDAEITPEGTLFNNNSVVIGKNLVRKSGTITAFANYNATVEGTVKATSANHGFATGTTADVTISGTANYNGTYIITKIDANNFYFKHDWVSTETGAWEYIAGDVTFSSDDDGNLVLTGTVKIKANDMQTNIENVYIEKNYAIPYVNKSISDIENYGAFVPGTVKATSDSHGLASNDVIAIWVRHGYYDGTYTITVIDEDSFYFTHTYSAGGWYDSGYWSRGNHWKKEEYSTCGLATYDLDAYGNPVGTLFDESNDARTYIIPQKTTLTDWDNSETTVNLLTLKSDQISMVAPMGVVVEGGLWADNISVDGISYFRDDIYLRGTNVGLMWGDGWNPPKELIKMSGSYNITIGDNTHDGDANIWVKQGRQIGFWVGSTKVAYIDADGFHTS